jgi:hypothetical protein
MKIDPNAPAYPASNAQCHGLTIRADIAARVLAGIVAGQNGSLDGSMSVDAKIAVKYADALIAELNREAV